MKWELISSQNSKDLIKTLLLNRGIKTKNEIDEFLNPNLEKVNVKSVGINVLNLKNAVKRINKAISEKQNIIIYGDYDVDGICASAILWETLNSLGAQVLPFIPSRFEQGYGLSKEGIDALISSNRVDLIITVDNGIVANEAVLYAIKKGIDVIITDHHTPSKTLPKAYSIIHTTNLCGAGVAYLLAKEFKASNLKFKIEQDEHLALVALATVADLVPLKNANRTLLFFGLQSLRNTKRPGLLALFQNAGIMKDEIGVYEIGHIIAPRLNAMGRMENAMDALRLICTPNKTKANDLAIILSNTNSKRQRATIESLELAKSKVNKNNLNKLIFIADENFQEGIVGLIAGRLVEEYYLPSIVISKGQKYSKASARSIKGFNITEFLRSAKDLLVDVGGHPMAAGFTVETEKLKKLEESLLIEIDKTLNIKDLQKSLSIDMELSEESISSESYQKLQQLAPFGMGNPEPTFLTRNLTVANNKTIGNDKKHLKINFKSKNSNYVFESLYFRGAEKTNLKIGDRVDIVYTLDENVWNGNKKLQLKIRDIKVVN